VGRLVAITHFVTVALAVGEVVFLDQRPAVVVGEPDLLEATPATFVTAGRPAVVRTGLPVVGIADVTGVVVVGTLAGELGSTPA